jgi:aspartyl-tRNA(Asn)/glutamyl-tRNA(Gln) amidotransferase subunit A
VSARGVIPDSWSFDHVGPMCRTVEDTAVLLSVISGYDTQDPASTDAASHDYAGRLRDRTASFRLGHVVFDGKSDTEANTEIESCLKRAFDVLDGLTRGRREIQLPSREDLFGSVADAEAYAFHASRLEKSPELYQPETREELLECGKNVSLAKYIQGRRDLGQLRRDSGRIFSDVDLLVTATMPRPPLLISEVHKAFPDMGHLCLGEFNILGLPAISIPCGFTSEEFPVGLQIIGPAFGEAKVLALARAYEQATGWSKRRPQL